MNTYIALFRGINVGGRNLLPMKDLIRIMEGLGCLNVQSYIRSGNVVFQFEQGNQGKIVEKISSKILELFEFKPKILIFESTELEVAVKNNPFEIKDGKALHFFFPEQMPDTPDFKELNAVKSDSEEFKLFGKVLYLNAPGGVGRSKLASQVEKILGVPSTARNCNTVNKLLAMVRQV